MNKKKCWSSKLCDYEFLYEYRGKLSFFNDLEKNKGVKKKERREHFQRMMDQILSDLPFCFVYVDDILIFSPAEDTHVQNLRQVF